MCNSHTKQWFLEGLVGRDLVQFVLLVGYHGQHGHLKYLRHPKTLTIYPWKYRTSEHVYLTNHGYIDHKGSTSQLPTTSGYEPFPRRIIPRSDGPRNWFVSPSRQLYTGLWDKPTNWELMITGILNQSQFVGWSSDVYFPRKHFGNAQDPTTKT